MARTRKRRIIIASLAVALLAACWLLGSASDDDPLFAFLGQHPTMERAVRSAAALIGAQDAFDLRVERAITKQLLREFERDGVPTVEGCIEFNLQR